MVATWQRLLFFLLLLLVILFTGVKAVTFYNNSDFEALLSLKKSISGHPLSSWDPTSDYCSSWCGVSCDSSGRVVSLNLTFSGGASLSGTFPDSIGYLLELKTLIISHQGISGEIPASVGKLRRLEILWLSGNNFSGNLPEQLTLLSSLLVVNLSSNSLSGEIPGGLIGSKWIQIIDLSNNRFSGEIPVDGTWECDNLRHLKLSNNLLEKGIPRQIGKCRNLRTLLLDGNILEGQIPPELGLLLELRVLDVSTNSLTGIIPKELANCSKLSVLVLTNSSNFVGGGFHGEGVEMEEIRLEFNAFDGGVPNEVLMLPSLQILWAPRANLKGRLPGVGWGECPLKVLHLGLNSLEGAVPEGLGMACKDLTFLDLSSNRFMGYLPRTSQVPCMIYFNVSRNNVSGALPSFGEGNESNCVASMISFGYDSSLDAEDIWVAFFNIPVWGPQMSTYLGSELVDDRYMIIHDFSFNQFSGLLPSFSLGNRFFAFKTGPGYRLFLNSNMFNGSVPGELVANCSDLLSFTVDLSDNALSGLFPELLLLKCPWTKELNAANNQISGSIASCIEDVKMLQHLDLRGNMLSGSLPSQLGSLKFLMSVQLGGNNLTGEIPRELGQLSSLKVLDLSYNTMVGSIPASLANASSLEVLLLNNNWLTGEIPASFSNLLSLRVLNVSYNHLTGNIPSLHFQFDCNVFRGNNFSKPCSSVDFPLNLKSKEGELPKSGNEKSLIIAVVSASVALCVALAAAIIIFGKKKSQRLSNLKGKVVVTFADAPSELTYENVVRATGNFSIRNLIGTGGFGSTYKAELFPGYLVAVKRLAIGRCQGVQQFDAEIRTLGRIRHKNLVTLIGYYVGESEMFLIYNYLSGGNLETFICNRSGTNVHWSIIHKITLDIAQALAYLHYSCMPRILHRDIKPSNILLDEDLNAYLSDFGLARLLEVSQTHATTDVAGTFGYVAPEYATTCRVSDKSDVYSFGVVLLELISGKKSLDPSFSDYRDGFNIVAWAKLLIKEGRSSELFTPELWEAGPQKNLLQMLKLASICTVESLSVRPSMKQVLGKLKHLSSPLSLTSSTRWQER